MKQDLLSRTCQVLSPGYLCHFYYLVVYLSISNRSQSFDTGIPSSGYEKYKIEYLYKLIKVYNDLISISNL